MTEPIRVLIVDDHPVFRDGLAALLDPLEGITVTGRVADGAQAVAATVSVPADQRPHVVIMDIQMPVLNGIEATRRIVQDTPEVGVLVVTMGEDDATVFSAVRAGARGYLLKGAGEEQIERAVRAVAAGEAIFDAQIATRVLAQFDQAVDPAVSALPMLTERELQVLRLLDQGLGNAAIAAELGVALKTVRNHVSNILAKLQARDRHEAVQRLHPHSDGEY